MFSFFFQAEDGIRDHCVTGFRRVLFRSVVRVGCEIYTADTVQQLRAIVERLERDEEAKK